jgi:hypothetical protein
MGVSVRPQSCYTANSYRAKAKRLGIPVDTLIRMLAIAKLGGQCVVCHEADPRVLQVNHIVAKDGTPRVREFVSIIEAGSTKHDVRCANCNIRYEYIRGRRSIPDNILALVSEV